jgi:hypothetical protein
MGPERLSSQETAAPPRAERRTIPWSYGDDRITAMAVDPARLYCYWEVSDQAIARARGGLRAGGADAWLNLRVYDITGRLFDGSNAHSHFDRGVGRADREHFFDIDKPGSEAVVELGMQSRAGAFVPMARSGRVGFPRREPVAWVEPEWMTVRAHTGEVVHESNARVGHDAAGHGHGGHGDGYGVPEPSDHWFEWVESDDRVPVWRTHLSWEELIQSDPQLGERSGWEALLRRHRPPARFPRKRCPVPACGFGACRSSYPLTKAPSRRHIGRAASGETAEGYRAHAPCGARGPTRCLRSRRCRGRARLSRWRAERGRGGRAARATRPASRWRRGVRAWWGRRRGASVRPSRAACRPRR